MYGNYGWMTGRVYWADDTEYRDGRIVWVMKEKGEL
jgi:hypothetical protein